MVNQLYLKLQTIGLPFGHDDVVVRGDPAERSFSVVNLREGRTTALDCVNAARDYTLSRRLVIDGTGIDRGRLAGPTVEWATLCDEAQQILPNGSAI